MLDKILLRIAKTAILNRFDSDYIIDKSSLIKGYPYLAAEGASFVTLHYDKELRGCIGSVVAHRALLDDIVENAISAAFRDPRFSPLHPDELSHLNLEVSVLTPPKLLEYEDFNDLCSKTDLSSNTGPIRGLFCLRCGSSSLLLNSFWNI